MKHSLGFTFGWWKSLMRLKSFFIQGLVVASSVANETRISPFCLHFVQFVFRWTAQSTLADYFLSLFTYWQATCTFLVTSNSKAHVIGAAPFFWHSAITRLVYRAQKCNRVQTVSVHASPMHSDHNELVKGGFTADAPLAFSETPIAS